MSIKIYLKSLKLQIRSRIKDGYDEDNNLYEECINEHNNEDVKKYNEYKKITDNDYKKSIHNCEKPNKGKKEVIQTTNLNFSNRNAEKFF
ncbi:12598_t:CDS:2 [Dentiscutata heterogama]|uniref:12598_t:CDS:1 n=1 Tax=Dentiscutata heterogama TaxID=1316150 RepID=A0ACA9JZV4_9GLOM|nr:12598_t:CDS:2 [Dentiscutata heterogama]